MTCPGGTPCYDTLQPGIKSIYEHFLWSVYKYFLWSVLKSQECLLVLPVAYPSFSGAKYYGMGWGTPHPPCEQTENITSRRTAYAGAKNTTQPSCVIARGASPAACAVRGDPYLVRGCP